MIRLICLVAFATRIAFAQVRVLHAEPPIFPDVEKARQQPNDVQVHVEVSAEGAATDARVTSAPNPPFDELAIAAALASTFEAKAGHTTIAVHFDPEAEVGETIEVHGTLRAIERGHATAPVIGAQDIRVEAGKLATEIPHHSSTELLGWAPGFLLTNEGGDGHAEQIFLRGFDAREGQDLELRVNGDVVNQAGNLHGNGYADLHFILPELVQALRVVEGPYDPRQGNFAVAGSADYELGNPRRGLTASFAAGSFGTERALLLWGGANPHDFGGVELYQTAGFGQNRDARRATVLGQTESALGDTGLWRLTTGLYLSDYHSAGVIREDDLDAGRKGFYDTSDFGQGGSAARAFVLGDIEHQDAQDITHHQLSLTAQTMRLREDFTGFLLDQQTPFQQPHGQRADLIDLESGAVTAQAQGYARRTELVATQKQELELGYFARLDATSGQQYRIQAATQHPYAKDTDLDAVLGDIGLYAALNAQLLPWLALRGGVRADLFTYNVIDNCAVHDVAHPSKINPPGDASCLSQQDYGQYREPVQRSTTSGESLLPRVSLFGGPVAGWSPSLSFGDGVRSIDPTYVSQDVKTPFARIRSYDAGVAYKNDNLTLRASGFRTHVDRDLLFSETVGRNVLAGGTTRLGASVSGRVTYGWLDQNASATYARSTFDDTSLLIPYVPDLVVRSDTVASTELGPFRGTVGCGLTFVGQRALPYGERSDAVVTIDGSASLAWAHYRLGLEATNLLDRRYRLGEYNFASDVHSEPQPTLAIARQFTAGAPRSAMLRLEVQL